MSELIKSIDQMTDEELLERLRQVRHNREIERPAAKRHIVSAEKKIVKKQANKLSKLLEGMSDEEKALFLKQLQEDA